MNRGKPFETYVMFDQVYILAFWESFHLLCNFLSIRIMDMNCDILVGAEAVFDLVIRRFSLIFR
jgi:hypothetical protein